MTLLMEKGFLPKNGREAALQVVLQDNARETNNRPGTSLWLERP